MSLAWWKKIVMMKGLMYIYNINYPFYCVCVLTTKVTWPSHAYHHPGCGRQQVAELLKDQKKIGFYFLSARHRSLAVKTFTFSENDGITYLFYSHNPWRIETTPVLISVKVSLRSFYQELDCILSPLLKKYISQSLYVR